MYFFYPKHYFKVFTKLKTYNNMYLTCIKNQGVFLMCFIVSQLKNKRIFNGAVLKIDKSDCYKFIRAF